MIRIPIVLMHHGCLFADAVRYISVLHTPHGPSGRSRKGCRTKVGQPLRLTHETIYVLNRSILSFLLLPPMLTVLMFGFPYLVSSLPPGIQKQTLFSTNLLTL